ncbi:NitT/TauT family transport system permease protein [Rhizobium sp. PP-F2F-G38]|nr:ABC transporter permease [Ferranicluibacter rubi]PYE34024.1 NitT/TauT family transport system permease protein [Rhizobium sp. PP-WC-1G-195]PYE96660.1 NitT/TauT family transport system permease protein [Rhizobium sp. PP-F2F-G38]TCP86072.1 NitT/TauT family transport system permease protein [Rhizobium sp. PP-CC-2G-626]TCQ23655.1 NitT/TauT family transport system permease protein [Rhizobium sp. PP-CC-3G-465]
MEAVLDSASSDETPGLGRSRLLKVAVPAIMLGLTLLAWEVYVRVNAVPPYILPAPSLVAQTLVKDWGTLYPALLVTLRITFSALILALIGGTVLAVLLVQSKWVELALYPYAVILQVTPIVAIAPLILVYVSSTQAAIMICAFLVAFFPILSNMVQGLKSVDHNLLNLYDLYGASRWQQLRLLKLPAALPYFMTGLKIGGGLSLIAAVVAEFAAGSAGAGSGLAFRLLEAQYRLNIPRLFAALVLLSATGVAIFALTSVVAWLSLRRWHESALAREN